MTNSVSRMVNTEKMTYNTTDLVAAPYFSKKRSRYMSAKDGRPLLYPARVVCHVQATDCLIVRFLDNSPPTPVIIHKASELCFPLSNDSLMRENSERLCSGFRKTVEKYGPVESALARLVRLGRPAAPSSVDDSGVAIAKWPQRCAETGARIVAGDSIVKSSGGWALALQTPPGSPAARPVRRSARIAALKA